MHHETDASVLEIPRPLLLNEVKTGDGAFCLCRHGQIIVCLFPNGNRKVHAIVIEKPAIIIYNTGMIYKVVEICTVTDEEIEKVLNEQVAKGYVFESIQFVTAVSSKRPTMAFLFFTKDE
jgi:hypothetical protein